MNRRGFLERFESRVCPEPNTGCWLWVGHCGRQGYGAIRFNDKMNQAHRVSFELAFGPIPDGRLVLHRCDTPACVNPGHLFLGDHVTNMADMRAKGRSRVGERNTNAKLNECLVREMRERAKLGVSYADLAKLFNCGETAVWLIVSRRTWRHVA